MKRCIQLAKKGTGFVSANPLVGCVLVKDEKILAEGYHKKYGDDHAERMVINKALNKGINTNGCELYVNLEPCSHFGKTPPCTDYIIKNKISKVHIGTPDPNPLVNGKGIKRLKENGIIVNIGVLNNECRKLNKFFFKYVSTGLPYITIKIAQSSDGFIADKNGKSKWITSIDSRKYVHKLRNEYDAVLIGRKTLEKDNPKLTVRQIKGRNPFRIIIDSELKSKINFKVFNDDDRDKTIIITKSKDKTKYGKFTAKGINVLIVKSAGRKLSLRRCLESLANLGITSILIEGGAITANEFISQNLVDELQIFTAPKIIRDGTEFLNTKNKSILKNFNEEKKIKFKKDILKIYKKIK